MDFKGKVVWITGASSGIGEALAYAFAAAGVRLVLSARRADRLAEVKQACAASDDVLLVPFDMTDAAERVAAVEQVLKHFGCIDIMVQNAGISQRALIADTALDVDRAIMELDYFAPVALTKLVLPSMLARNSGHFVVTSSVAGKMGIPMRSAYCAAKHALHGFFDTLLVECAPQNIAVSLLVVAGVKSEVSLHALTGDGGRWGKMDDIQSQGMDADVCARRVLQGVARKQHEINILVPPTGRFLFLRRFAPGFLYGGMAKRLRARGAVAAATKP